jgi:VWFA-related protein
MIASSVVRAFLFFLPLYALAYQGGASTASGLTNGQITLDVVANDKSGRPVSGLQQADFTIVDNKQPQQIVSFEAAGQNASGNNSVEIVVVVDSVNTSFLRVGYVRDQISKFLRQDGGRLSRPVSFAFSSDSGFSIQNAPSLDGNALVTYLNQQETALRSIRRSQGFYGAVDRSQLSLRALGELAAYEAKKPGRKLVVWISPGWPLLSGPRVQLSSKDEQNIFNSIVAMSTQLRQSRITLYSVDPLGTADSGGFRTFYYEQFLKGVSAPKQVQFGDLALQVLASQSGGRVLNGNNDLGGEIETCVRDANAYYVLSFSPRPADGPNEYHAIQVKIAQPQLKAQTRSGYYAQPARP